jgi:hypothetical protein
MVALSMAVNPNNHAVHCKSKHQKFSHVSSLTPIQHTQDFQDFFKLFSDSYVSALKHLQIFE